MAEALAADGFERPSAIQEAAMPRIARREDVVIHAHTGSGKTLAFLVPMVLERRPRFFVGGRGDGVGGDASRASRPLSTTHGMALCP